MTEPGPPAAVRLAFPDAGAGPVAAASLIVPLAGVSRAGVLAAPLVAAWWARAVAAVARGEGVIVRVDAAVTADLAGIIVEAIDADRTALRALPAWFDAAPAAADPRVLAGLRAECLGRLSPGQRRSDEVRRALFGTRHRYGIGHGERVRFLRGAGCGEIAAAAGELLGARPAGPAGSGGSPAVASGARFASGERRVARIAGERAYCLLGTPGVALGSARKFPLHVAWALLGGREGLLDRRLRRERGLTYSLAAFGRELAEGGYGMCFAGCRPAGLDEVAGGMAEVLASLGRDGVDERLLRSAKERLIIQRHRALQVERGRAERLAGYEVAGLGAAELAGYPDRIAAVTAEEVRAVAADLLAPDTLLEIKMVPAAGS